MDIWQKGYVKLAWNTAGSIYNAGNFLRRAVLTTDTQ